MSEELRVRRRYVDLIVRDEARRTVRQRADGRCRRSATGLTARGYLEVETPMLQTVHGGATARPFRTHMNAFDLDLYLRIAPELFLKRCIVGGLDRVFEINRNFRNEGADSSHSPEFAMLEFYQAYADYQDMATAHPRADPGVAAPRCSATTSRGTTTAPRSTCRGEWPQVPLYGVVVRGASARRSPRRPRSRSCARIAERHDVGVDPAWVPGKLVEELFEALVQHTLQAPDVRASTTRSTPRR